MRETGAAPVAVRLRITGRVQRVGFRAFTQRAALRHGLVGWVANVADGSVEARVAGPPEALALLRVELAEGPMFSRVDDIQEMPLAEPEAWPSFEITATLR